MNNVIHLSEVNPYQPPCPANWRDLMNDYINKIDVPRSYAERDKLYSKAKLRLMEFVPLRYYDEMLELLLAKLRL